jgi:hypothetical protein
MKRVEIAAYDDLDWTEKQAKVPASHTVLLGLDRKWVELDLTEAHTIELAEFLARYMKAGNKPEVPPPAPPELPGATSMGEARRRNAAIVAWAEANGHKVTRQKSGGYYIPIETRRAYRAAHAAPPPPEG